MGLAFVNGLQHGGLQQGVAATAKHFAGYGGGMDDEKEFFEETLFPFEAVIRLGGVKSVMPGYHSYKGEKCIGNKELLTDILRNTLDFDGVIVSDYGAIGGIGLEGAKREVITVTMTSSRRRREVITVTMTPSRWRRKVITVTMIPRAGGRKSSP